LSNRTFYDIHMHAFNLSHPSAGAFLRRIAREVARKLVRCRHLKEAWAIVGLSVILGILWIAFGAVWLIPRARRWIRRLIQKGFDRVRKQVLSAVNLLSVLENDLGSFFFLMENCLRETPHRLLDEENRLHVAGETYTEIVLTPLMMDFGYKAKQPSAAVNRGWSYHYDKPAGKPIVEQVVDVFNAIRTYGTRLSGPDLAKTFEYLDSGAKRVFRIYPFLGLNPANYSTQGITRLLDKYFGEYTCRKEDLDRNVGAFNGDIDAITSNFFAGIKVYPPLGFNPWPTDSEDRKKVEEIYRRAQEKGIPITCHGGHGGFRVVTKDEAKTLAAVAKWEAVLGAFEGLKLNLAHFPMAQEKARREGTLALVLGRDNVYVDISCRATKKTYYDNLRDLLDDLDPADRAKLLARTLFGSDFAVNLMWIESYNAYVRLFSETKALTPEEKVAMCSTNPERFLFGRSS
jgi:hypothetical protein